MKKNIPLIFMICLSFVLVSCGDNDVLPPAATGWVIGLTTDEATGASNVKILKTSDGGANWFLQTLPSDCAGFQGNDISAASYDVAWAAMGHPAEDNPTGGILRTADGGSTWTIQTLPDGMISRHIKGIKAVSTTEAWAVSLRGDVLHTTDSGKSWNIVEARDANGNIITMQQVNRIDVTGHDIWIVDPLAGSMGVIHSPDDGATWWREPLPDVGASHGPLAISAFSSLAAWAAVNSEGNLWWTSNGGRSWNKSIDSLTGTADYDDINASSGNVVWIACNGDGPSGGFTARVTVTDGGFQSNTTHHSPYMMEGVSPLTDQKAWAVGFKVAFVSPDLPLGAIYFTEDGGLSWQAQSLPDDARNVSLWKVSFVGARR